MSWKIENNHRKPNKNDQSEAKKKYLQNLHSIVSKTFEYVFSVYIDFRILTWLSFLFLFSDALVLFLLSLTHHEASYFIIS